MIVVSMFLEVLHKFIQFFLNIRGVLFIASGVIFDSTKLFEIFWVCKMIGLTSIN